MAPAGALRELTLALGAAVAVLGSLLFIAVKIYFRGTDTGTGTGWSGWWERELRELRDRAPPGDVLDWRQVLVLGLDGAGKSSVLHYLCSQTARDRIAPTRGFNSAQLFIQGMEMDLLEVGGSQNLRAYWPHYLDQAHVLVFVVDSVDRSRLLTARQELHALLANDPRLPLVVLANKQSSSGGAAAITGALANEFQESTQAAAREIAEGKHIPKDKSDALSTAELQEELALHTLSGQRELFLLPTSATWDGLNTATSVLHVKSLLVTLLSQP